jgi:hypothetical protein
MGPIGQYVTYLVELDSALTEPLDECFSNYLPPNVRPNHIGAAMADERVMRQRTRDGAV